MTRRQRRATFIGLGVGILCVAVFLVLLALRDKVVGFHFPTDVAERQIPVDRRIRLGGVVAAGSVKRGEGTTVRFGITDKVATVPVRYTGILPDLFREGQGVIAEGKLDAAGRFIADTVLAKHDENYMPPEVAKALKEQGVWQHTGQTGDAPSPRATPASPSPPIARGEGRGEGHTPTSAPAAAPHPSPLPASGERGSGSARQ